ncbi:MAG: AhpC/TSA family protein [Acidobacteria bacterium]|nr:AhpC/TSA family protein [Acidobacteriota bacterium]
MDWRGAAKGELAADSIDIPLRERLARIRATVDALIPADRMAPVERAIAELSESGLAGRILPFSSVAPAFSLPDQSGRVASSADFLSRGPLILVFYRGRWCPYDVTTLEAWNQWLPRIQALGATLAAISPQKLQHTSFTADQHKLQYPVLSDAGNAVARQFGLIYRLPEYLQQHYRRVFVNLNNSNGDNTWELPLPATYVLDRNGTVLHARADPDFRLRAEPAEVLASLEQKRK